MSLTREDMLRELELLPVWRPRIAAVAPLPSIEIQPSAPVAAESRTEETLVMVRDEAPTEPVNMPAMPADPQLVETSVTAETKTAESGSESLIQSPWLLLCPQAGDDAAQTLLQNIMRALKLPAEVVLLHQQNISCVQVQSRFCVLFGLEAANHFLGTAHTDIAMVRGQVLRQGDMCCVITHHPQAMLAQPALKKDVWHDLCLLLAEQE